MMVGSAAGLRPLGLPARGATAFEELRPRMHAIQQQEADRMLADEEFRRLQLHRVQQGVLPQILRRLALAREEQQASSPRCVASP